jgi:hypothetical protein
MNIFIKKKKKNSRLCQRERKEGKKKKNRWTKTAGRVLTEMVRTNLESLLAAHKQANLFGRLVLQKFHLAGTTLLPLLIFCVKTEELCPPARRQDIIKKMIELNNKTNEMNNTQETALFEDDILIRLKVFVLEGRRRSRSLRISFIVAASERPTENTSILGSSSRVSSFSFLSSAFGS